MSFLTSDCTLRLLTQELSQNCKPFVCDDNDLCEFFAEDFIAFNQDLFGKTYCFTLDKDPSVIVCAFTISNDSIKARLLPKTSKNRVSRKVTNQKRGLKSYPAVLIGRLGVSVDFEGQGLGRELMDFIKAWFIDGGNKTGCRFLVVDSYNKERPLSYYTRNNFKYIFDDEEDEQKYSGVELEEGETLDTRLLYFDLIVLAK